MQTSRLRLLAISGATLALVVAGSATVSANHDADGQRGFGRDRANPDAQRGQRGDHPRMFSQRGQRSPGGRRDAAGGRFRAGIAENVDHFVRRETIVELEDGITTRRVDNGTVNSASDAGLDYTIATGESASVTTDEDTKVVAFTAQTIERRGHSRERLVPEEIALADIEPGSQVVVWAQSQDDGTFLAQRIVIRPMVDATTDAADADATDANAAATEDAAIAPVTDA